MGNTGPESDVPSAASGGGGAGLRPAGAGAGQGRWSGALEALDRILNRGGDADDVLRSVVTVLAREPKITWAGIAFLEEDELALGPKAGEPDETNRTCVPISFQGTPVGELWVDGEAEPAFLERVAVLISAYVLIGWDTRGEAWEP